MGGVICDRGFAVSKEHVTETLERHKIPFVDSITCNEHFWCKAKDVQRVILKLEREVFRIKRSKK